MGFLLFFCLLFPLSLSLSIKQVLVTYPNQYLNVKTEGSYLYFQSIGFFSNVKYDLNFNQLAIRNISQAADSCLINATHGVYSGYVGTYLRSTAISLTIYNLTDLSEVQSIIVNTPSVPLNIFHRNGSIIVRARTPPYSTRPVVFKINPDTGVITSTPSLGSISLFVSIPSLESVFLIDAVNNMLILLDLNTMDVINKINISKTWAFDATLFPVLVRDNPNQAIVSFYLYDRNSKSGNLTFFDASSFVFVNSIPLPPYPGFIVRTLASNGNGTLYFGGDTFYSTQEANTNVTKIFFDNNTILNSESLQIVNATIGCQPGDSPGVVIGGDLFACSIDNYNNGIPSEFQNTPRIVRIG